MPLTLGFTGTRRPLTIQQYDGLRQQVKRLAPTAVVHGCCLGADEEFAKIVTALVPRPRMRGRPSNLPNWTSEVACRLCDDLSASLPPLERNGNIVADADVLLACPGGMEEEVRSGTWATIRKARWRRMPIVLCWPDGTVTTEGPAEAPKKMVD